MQIASPMMSGPDLSRCFYQNELAPRAAAEVTAERAVLAYLDGSCHTPIAASAIYGDDGALRLDAMILRPNGEAGRIAVRLWDRWMTPPALVRSSRALLTDAEAENF